MTWREATSLTALSKKNLFSSIPYLPYVVIVLIMFGMNTDRSFDKRGI